MRTKTINLYTFDELSDDAKEVARAWYRDNSDYPWSDENRQSLDAFCNAFPVKVRDWSYDAWNYSVNSSVTCDDETGELTGARLVAYLVNHYSAILWSAKKYEKTTAGKVAARISKIGRTVNDCPFTGYSVDEDLLDDIRAYIKKPDGRNFEELLTDCVDNWGKACRDDAAASQSDESVDDAIHANEYEFTQEGERA